MVQESQVQGLLTQTIADGDWSSSSTWDSNGVPSTDLSDAVVNIDHRVEVNTTVKLQGDTTININDILKITSGGLEIENTTDSLSIKNGLLIVSNGDVLNKKGTVNFDYGRVQSCNGNYKDESSSPYGTFGIGTIYSTNGNIENINSGAFSSNIEWCIDSGDGVNLPISENCSVANPSSDSCNDEVSYLTIISSLGSSGSSSASSTSINFEDFEGGSFPYGIWQDGGDNCLMTSSYAISGSYSPYVAGNTSSSVMYTSDLDLTSYDSVTIEFDYSAWGFDSGEDFFIEFSDDGGSTWNSTPIAQYVYSTDFSNYTVYSDVLVTVQSSAFNFTSNSRFRFRTAASSIYEDITFDNIELIGYSSSSSNGGASSTCTTYNSENFDSGSFSGTIWNDGGYNCGTDSSWVISGADNVYLRDNTSSSVMYTDDIDLSSYTSVTIEFDFRTWSYDSGEDFFIEFSDDGGLTWDSTPVLQYVRGTDFSDNSTIYSDIVATAESSTYNFTANSRFRFRGDASSSSEYVYFDNIEINVCTSTPSVDPCDPVASGNIDSDGDGISDVCDLDDDNDGIVDHNECNNLLIDSGFNNKTGLSNGNNIGVDISPWILGGGNQANIVKVDGAGGYDYGNGGPFEDANPATGDGEYQYYLDIASGSNDFYQSFTLSSDALFNIWWIFFIS